MKLSSASVQFTDAASVLSAWDSQEAITWAIFHGNQLLWKFEGSDENKGREKLKQVLTVVQNSAAVYTLKMYEGKKKVAAGSAHDCSFNFRLQNDTLPYQGGNYILQQMEKKFETLQQEIIQLRLENAALQEEGEEEENNFLGGLGNIPGMNEALGALVKNLVGGIAGGAPDPQRVGIAGITMNDEEKLTQAMAILAEADPQLPDHLYKLAMLAKKDPAKFKNLLQVLDTF